VDNIWDFDPENVPTIQQVVNQLNANYHAHGVIGSEGTDLHPHIVYFQGFVNKLSSANVADLDEKADERRTTGTFDQA